MPDPIPIAPIPVATPALLAALAGAATALGRLDQALHAHRLQPAILYRARLEAVRRHAASDGHAIDPWHLAAMLAGLRPRLDRAPRIIERGLIFEAARTALRQHQFLTEPTAAQQAEISRAATVLAQHDHATPLLAAAQAFHAWINAGHPRAPMRAALVGHWTRSGLLPAPVPLTGTAAFQGDTAWEPERWIPTFLDAIAGEAAEALHLIRELERAWAHARHALAPRRASSRAPAAIDLMAAMPVVSASTLASALGMARNNAGHLLAELAAQGIAIEVSHRAKRRLFGLPGLAPLRDAASPPRRPTPGRGRGRPRQTDMPAAEPAPDTTAPPPPSSRPDRRPFDYHDLDAAMRHADHAIRQARQTLDDWQGTQPTVGGLGRETE